MENVYRELDNVKVEMERLKAELQVEKGISDSLKKSHREHLIKFQDAKREVEKQAQELTLKLDEIFQVRKVSETLRSCLHEKESSLRHLSSLHEKLKADHEVKLKKLEGENKELAFAFDEVSEKNKELEQNACAAAREIDALKRRLLATEKKCFGAEQKAQEANDMRQRGDVIMKLEEENRNAQDQLKWKKEQFIHLEEAHRRLQGQFKLDKEEWEGGKLALLEEISTLQTSLDSKSRVLEDVQRRLEMCNQALAREESRRKLLEIQVSEFRSRYEDVFAQCQQERSKFESLTLQRDEEIAKLRFSIGTRDTSKKEMDIRIARLEQENQELSLSLKDMQESLIRNVGDTKLTKLRNKLRGLEQEHSKCSTNLKAKESEWSSQIQKMKGDINGYSSEMKGKEKKIQETQLELESCHSMIEVLSEEISIILTIFKSEFMEAFNLKFNPQAGLDLCGEMDDKISVLTAQLEMKDCDLRKALLELEQEHEQVEILMKRLRCLELAEERQNTREEELKQHNEEILKNERESLFVIIEEKNKTVEVLQQQVVLLSAAVEAKNEEVEECRQDNESLIQYAKDKDSCTENLHKNITWLEQECFRREMEATILARYDVEKYVIQNNKKFFKVINEKDQIIQSLEVYAVSLEEELTIVLTSSFAVAVENLVTIDVLNEALNKARHMSELQREERNRRIVDLEKQVTSSGQRLIHQEEAMLQLKQKVEELEALLEAKNLETNRLITEQNILEGKVKQLEYEKSILFQDTIKLSKETGHILVHLEEFCDRIGELAYEDTGMMDVLETMLQGVREDVGPQMGLTVNNLLYDSTQENEITTISASARKIEASAGRLPLKEMNHPQLS